MSAQAGSLPSLNSSGQKMHFSVVPRRWTVGNSGVYEAFSCGVSSGSPPQLKYRAPYGHAAMQYRHPMQMF